MLNGSGLGALEHGDTAPWLQRLHVEQLPDLELFQKHLQRCNELRRQSRVANSADVADDVTQPLNNRKENEMSTQPKKTKKTKSKTTVIKLQDLKGKKTPKGGGKTLSSAQQMGGGWMSTLRN